MNSVWPVLSILITLSTIHDPQLIIRSPKSTNHDPYSMILPPFGTYVLVIFFIVSPLHDSFLMCFLPVQNLVFENFSIENVVGWKYFLGPDYQMFDTI